MSILKGPEGGYSSKRITGLAYALVGIIMALTDLFSDKEITMEIFLIVVSTALASLGISSISYFGKPDIVNRDKKV